MEDITIQKYFELKDKSQYDAILKHLKPANKLGTGQININKMTYKKVRICMELIKTGKTVKQLQHLFCLAYGIESNTFMDLNIKEFFAAQNFLIKEFFNLQQREAKLLQSIDSDSALWEMAGGDKLNKFGNLMPLVQLGEIYGIFPYDLEDKLYTQVLTLLVLHKEKAGVLKEYNFLKSKQK